MVVEGVVLAVACVATARVCVSYSCWCLCTMVGKLSISPWGPAEALFLFTQQYVRVSLTLFAYA